MSRNRLGWVAFGWALLGLARVDWGLKWAGLCSDELGRTDTAGLGSAGLDLSGLDMARIVWDENPNLKLPTTKPILQTKKNR